jgi:hypothetical protein
VIKELSSHLGDGVGAIVSSWSLYVLIVAGAATMLLAAQALAAGPLAASQPGFTILDPLSASMLGLFLFGEHIQARIADLAGEAAALALVIAGVSALSRSHLIVGEHGTPPGPQPDTRRTPTANGPDDDRSAGWGAGGARAGCLCCAAGPVWVRPRCYGIWPSARRAGECVAHRARACSDSRPAQVLSDRLASSERLLHFAAAPNEKRPVPRSEPACELRFWSPVTESNRGRCHLVCHWLSGPHYRKRGSQCMPHRTGDEWCRQH